MPKEAEYSELEDKDQKPPVGLICRLGSIGLA